MNNLRSTSTAVAACAAAWVAAACFDAPTEPESSGQATLAAATDLGAVRAAMADVRVRLLPALGDDPLVGQLAGDVGRLEATLDLRDAPGIAAAADAARVAAEALSADAPPDGTIAAADVDAILLALERVGTHLR